MNRHKRLSAAVLGFYAASVIIQFLVLVKAIPFDWVNGGRSASYGAQSITSVVSIIVLVALGAFCWRLIGAKSPPSRVQIAALYLVTAFWVIGLVMQLLGTNFERYVLSVVLLLGVVSHFQLIHVLKADRAE